MLNELCSYVNKPFVYLQTLQSATEKCIALTNLQVSHHDFGSKVNRDNAIIQSTCYVISGVM